MEVLGDVHVIESDERIKVLLFDLDMSQLLDFHHKFILLLVTESLVNQNVFDIILLFAMDRKILIFKFVLILVVCRSDVFRVISGLLGGRWYHTFSYLRLISITYCGSTCFTLGIV